LMGIDKATGYYGSGGLHGATNPKHSNNVLTGGYQFKMRLIVIVLPMLAVDPPMFRQSFL